MTDSNVVILIHGFTASPDYMKPLALAFEEIGYKAICPELPGHGIEADNLKNMTEDIWYRFIEKFFLNIYATHKNVFVIGHSLGGLLTLQLAENHSDKIKGIAVLGAPLHLHWSVEILIKIVRYSPLRWIYTSHVKGKTLIADPKKIENLASISVMPVSAIHAISRLGKSVQKNLNHIKIPVLVIHGKNDLTAPPDNATLIHEGLSSSKKKLIFYKNSYHILTHDCDAHEIEEEIKTFFLSC